MKADILTNAQDALLALFAQDALLSGYNWQKWDSDNAVDLPRGYVNVAADGELDYGTMFMVQFEVVLEGRPKGPKFSGAMLRLQKIVLAVNLHSLLNQRAVGIRFTQRGEQFRLQQTVQGVARARVISFRIAATIEEEE